MSNTAVSFKIGADNSDALKALKDLRDEFKTLRTELKSAVADVKIKISPDKLDSTEFSKNLTGNQKIKVGIDFGFLKEQITLAKNLLSQLKVEIKTSGLNELEELKSQLKTLKDQINKTGTEFRGLGDKAQAAGKKASDSLKDVEHSAIKAEHGLSPLAESIKNIHARAVNFVAMASGAMSGAFIANTILTANYVKELERAAQLSNITTQEMQKQAYAANTVGFSLEKLSDVYKDVNDKVGDFLSTGGGELKDFFEQIAPKVGVTAQQFYNLSGPQALQLYFDTLQKANLSQAQMTFYMEAIANDASVLIPLLKDNGAAFQRLSEQAQKLGIILDDVSIAKAKAFQTAFSQVQSTVVGLTRTLGVELAPALTDISDRFVEFAVDNADGIRSAIESVSNLFNDILSVADTVFTEIGSLWSDLTGSIEEGTGVQIGFFDLLSATLEGVGLSFRFVTMLIKSLFEMLKYVVRTVVLGVIEDFNNFKSGFDTLKANIDLIITSLKINFNSLGEIIKSAFRLDWEDIKNNFNTGAAELEKAIKAHKQRIKDIESDKENKQQAINDSRASNDKALADGMGDAIGLVGDWFDRQFDRNGKKDSHTSSTSTSGFKGGGYVAPPDDKAKQKADEAKRQAQALANAKYEYEKKLIDQQYKDNEQLYKNQEIGFLAYSNKKDDLNKKLHELEINYLDQQAAKATQHEKNLLDYKRKNIDLEARNRGEALYRENVEYIKELEKRKKAILDIISDNNVEVANLNDFEKSLLEVSKRFDKTREKINELKKSLGENVVIDFTLPDGSIIKLSRDLIDGLQKELNKQQFEMEAKITFNNEINQVQKDIDKILSDKQYRDRYYDIQEKQNPMKKIEIDDARRQSARNASADLKAKQNELINLQNSPDAANMSAEEAEALTKQIQDLNIAILQMKENSKSAFQQFATDLQAAASQALVSGLNTFFTDLIEGSKSAGDALKDFVRGFVKAIGQLIVQALAAQAVLLVLNAIPGGTAVASAMDLAAPAAKSVSASKHHTGGIAGTSGTRSNIDLAAYNHAPRYHAGGIAGLAPNEVPAILERGEEVLTRNDPRHVANGGGGSNMSVRVINQIQDSEIHDAVATPSGERTIVNIIGRNASAIRKILEDS